jgi:hypothetical protein
MRIINHSQIPVEHRKSKKGRSELNLQQVSLVRGDVMDVGDRGGDHAAQTEFRVVRVASADYSETEQ